MDTFQKQIQKKAPSLGGGAYMLSIFYQIKTHPPCSTGIIMTTTIVMIVRMVVIICTLYLNIDELSERMYSCNCKKQRTQKIIFSKHTSFLQTCVSIK